MADTDSPPAAASENDGDAAADFQIKKLYLKDISFESPNSPHVFTQEWKPNVDMQLNSEVRRFGSDDYEVTLTTTVTVKVGDATAFLCEVQAAGMFGIAGVSDAEMGPLLGSYCPNILFPYLREAVSDLSVRGGFPQLVLAPVNFEALYARHMEEQAGTGTPAAAASPAGGNGPAA